MNVSGAASGPPSDSIRQPLIAGLAIVAIFFGGFGTWAVTAPLNGAVVADAVIKVDGNRKSVQHLDGGIVSELRVQEGQSVSAGDLLVRLDDSEARAQYDVLSQQYFLLVAIEARLMVELAHGTALQMPKALVDAGDDPYVKGTWAGQLRQLESRNAAFAGQQAVVGERIRQLQSQIVGLDAQAKSFSEQLDSTRGEIGTIGPLVEKGLTPRSRLLQLERSASALEGQLASARAEIAKLNQSIAEQRLGGAQLDNERMTEVTKNLREVQTRLLKVIPERASAEARLLRSEIRAPYAGRVVALAVFSVNGVVRPGEKIMDIVPDEDGLVAEAQIAVTDIADVRPGMPAIVQLTAYKQRSVPSVAGTVTTVSADRLNDATTGMPHYAVQVRLDEAALAALPGIQLYPGMPATVQIPTVERTVFDYLVGPLTDAFSRAMREK